MTPLEKAIENARNAVNVGKQFHKYDSLCYVRDIALILAELDRLREVERVVIAAAINASEGGEVMQCGLCNGDGWVIEIEPAHHPDCDGSCRGGKCPVPTPAQKQCPRCYGSGQEPSE